MRELRALCALSSRIQKLGRQKMLHELAAMNEGRGYPPAKLLAQMDDVERIFGRIRRNLGR